MALEVEKTVEGRRSHKLPQRLQEKSQPWSDPMGELWSVNYSHSLAHGEPAGLLCSSTGVSQWLKAAGGDRERRQDAGAEQNSQAPPQPVHVAEMALVHCSQPLRWVTHGYRSLKTKTQKAEKWTAWNHKMIRGAQEEYLQCLHVSFKARGQA